MSNLYNNDRICLKIDAYDNDRIIFCGCVCTADAMGFKQANKSRLTQAITDVLPEASKWMTGLYPKTNKKGDFLGSVAIEFEKREEGESEPGAAFMWPHMR